MNFAKLNMSIWINSMEDVSKIGGAICMLLFMRSNHSDRFRDHLSDMSEPILRDSFSDPDGVLQKILAVFEDIL